MEGLGGRRGTEVDGDQIMAILALALKDRGQLHEDTLVATVMSNLGLLNAMTAAGVTVKQTAVGDRYVLEEMRASGHSLGGEQSGHVIMLEHGTTGDGVLTALALAATLVTGVDYVVKAVQLRNRAVRGETA